MDQERTAVKRALESMSHSGQELHRKRERGSSEEGDCSALKKVALHGAENSKSKPHKDPCGAPPTAQRGNDNKEYIASDLSRSNGVSQATLNSASPKKAAEESTMKCEANSTVKEQTVSGKEEYTKPGTDSKPAPTASSSATERSTTVTRANSTSSGSASENNPTANETHSIASMGKDRAQIIREFRALEPPAIEEFNIAPELQSLEYVHYRSLTLEERKQRRLDSKKRRSGRKQMREKYRRELMNNYVEKMHTVLNLPRNVKSVTEVFNAAIQTLKQYEIKAELARVEHEKAKSSKESHET